MVPLMTAYARMSQHQAVGTSSAAVAGTGMAAIASFGSAGAVDYAAAAALASTAMLTARFGARLTSAFNPVQLQRAFACFQLGVAPLVPLKGALTRSRKGESAAAPTTDPTDAVAPPKVPAPERIQGRVYGAIIPQREASAPRTAVAAESGRMLQLVQLAALGSVAGVASGMFGIGGGLILTPALCLMTDMPHATVLGTTLTSMVPPSLVSAATHTQLGNVVTAVVAPLVVGAAAGAFFSGQLAVGTPEQPLQWGFAIFCAASGGHKLLSLRGR